jgi:hypothetical protein
VPFWSLVRPFVASTSAAWPSVAGLIWIWRGFASSALGNDSRSSPFSNVAVAASVFSALGSVTVRLYEPRRISRYE